MLACSAAAVLSLSVWPKPQKQVDAGGPPLVLDASGFRFEAAGKGADSELLLDAFKRYRGIILGRAARKSCSASAEPAARKMSPSHRPSSP